LTANTVALPKGRGDLFAELTAQETIKPVALPKGRGDLFAGALRPVAASAKAELPSARTGLLRRFAPRNAEDLLVWRVDVGTRDVVTALG
jgi:hypothetical protein